MVSPLVPGRAAIAALCIGLPSAASAQSAQYWMSSYAVPPTQALPGTEFGGYSARQNVHASLGGSQVRLRISNLYGAVPLVIGVASIAVPTGLDTISPATAVAFTFGGKPTVTIPVGAVAVSDAASFTVAPNTDYLVSTYTPQTTGAATYHFYASHYDYAAPGNQTAAAKMPKEFSGTGVVFISGLDVAQPTPVPTIVAFGDSITDGFGSTFQTDSSWPNDLAAGLAAAGMPTAVANAGLSSNQLLKDGAPGNNQNGLARLDRDVLALPGITAVISADGINDIGLGYTSPNPTAGSVIAGYQQLIDRAHERGLKIYGATLTPCQGAGYYSTVFETKRQTINTFIRTSGAFDGVMDFDAAIRNPATPTAMLPAYDSGDHLHPSSAGYQAMANAALAVLLGR